METTMDAGANLGWEGDKGEIERRGEQTRFLVRCLDKFWLR